MSFRVVYQPSAAAVGGAARAAGVGDFRKWLAEYQLKQQSMAQQDMQQQRAIAANQASQMFAAQNQWAGRQFEAANDFNRMGWANQFNQANRNAEIELADRRRKEDHDFVRERDADAAERREEERLAAEEARRTARRETYDMGVVANAEELERRRLEKGLSDGTLEYTQPQIQRRQELTNDLAEVDTNEELDDEQRFQAKLDIQQELARIKPVAKPPDKQPKTFEQQVEGRVGLVPGIPNLAAVINPEGKIELRELKGQDSKPDNTGNEFMLKVQKAKAADIRDLMKQPIQTIGPDGKEVSGFRSFEDASAIVERMYSGIGTQPVAPADAQPQQLPEWLALVPEELAAVMQASGAADPAEFLADPANGPTVAALQRTAAAVASGQIGQGAAGEAQPAANVEAALPPEAQQPPAGYGYPNGDTTKVPLRLVKDQGEFEKLPLGTKFIGPDGRTYLKDR